MMLLGRLRDALTKRDLTISIATRNRPDLLSRVVNHLGENGKLPCLVDVVIDSSKDYLTQKTCEEFVERFGEEFKWDWNPGRGLAAARNHGARMCRSKFIRFHDDDDLISRSDVEALTVAHLKQPKDIILTHTRTDPKFDRPFVEFLTWKPGYVFNYRIVPKSELTFDFFWGGRTSLPIQVFERHKFDEDFVFGAEDIEFGYRITQDGWTIKYLKEISALQIRDFSVEQICVRAYNQGFSQGIILEKYGEGALQQWATEGLNAPGIEDLRSLINQLTALKREGARLDAAGNDIEEVFGNQAKALAYWVWEMMFKTSKQIGLEAKYLGYDREEFIGSQLKDALF